jgi:hypothetical protein
MAELVNGHITVRTGLVDSAAAVPAGRLPRSRRPSDGELRARVLRLRRDGWSYRRIAATLELRYAMVAEILDGPTIWVGDYRDVSPVPATASSDGVIAPSSISARDDAVEAVLHQHARLSDKVDALLRAAEQQRNALARLESSILATVRAENSRLAERVMAGVKALFERLLPVSSRRDDRSSGD